jgi:tetrahydromethanopterin S-methyltransferase subunit G
MPKAIFITSDYNEYKSMFEQISKRLEVKTQSVDSLIKKKKRKIG